MLRRLREFLVPLAAVVVLVASALWMNAAANSTAWAPWGPGGWGPGGWGPGGWGAGGCQPGLGMLGGPARSGGLPGDGRAVSSLDEAARRAEDFGRTLSANLRAGEVMRFSNHYYVELTDTSGVGATEVLVDPTNGAVQLEHGPAMMWNTTYGLMGGAASAGTAGRIGPEQARDLANQWLTARNAGQDAEEAERFPGYYTLHQSRNGQVEGMLSVHAETGQVWPHSWHGPLVDARA